MTKKQASRKFGAHHHCAYATVLAETERSFCGPSTVVLRPQAGGFASHPFGWFALVAKHEYLMQTVHNLGQCISALKMPAYLPAYGMAASANLTK